MYRGGWRSRRKKGFLWKRRGRIGEKAWWRLGEGREDVDGGSVAEEERGEGAHSGTPGAFIRWEEGVDCGW